MARTYQPLVAVLFLLLATSTLSAEEHELRAIIEVNFEAADANSDGSLDSSEFPALIDANAEHDIGRSAMVKRFGAYKRAFGTVDQDGDGSITWTEIATAQKN